MSETKLECQIMQLLSEICGDPALDLQTRLIQDLRLDQLEWQQLLSALNQHFGIGLTPAEYRLSASDTVESLCQWVRYKIHP
ncbi:MAG: acyl carrier protein [Candidatus Sericytochromatia bacterium]